MKIRREILILLPLIFVVIGAALRNYDAEWSKIFRYTAILYMVLFVIFKRKYPANLFLSLIVFLPFLIYGIIHSFNIKAGIEDGIRYLLPFIALFYGYSIKEYFNTLIRFVIILVVINFSVQIINYIYWLNDIPQWYYFKTRDGVIFIQETAGIIRASGIVTLFAFYAFLNLISFILIYYYYNGKYRKLFLALSFFNFISALSYKTIGVAIVILILFYFKKIFQFIKYTIPLFLILIIVYHNKLNLFIQDIYLRIHLYITGGQSMRAESYRVMFREIFSGNWFGRGVGTFGGPGSIKYNSPYYDEVHFNWWGMEWADLPTTDTFPPHAFVELGIIGGLVYFLSLLVPLISRHVPKPMLMIYIILFVDMLFTFSLNNIEYVMFSFLFIYPIYYYHQYLNQSSQSKQN